MMKVWRFNLIRDGGGGGGWVYLPPPPHKIRTAIDFSEKVLTFNFYVQLKHDMRSLRYVFTCFVERR